MCSWRVESTRERVASECPFRRDEDGHVRKTRDQCLSTLPLRGFRTRFIYLQRAFADVLQLTKFWGCNKKLRIKDF